METTKYRQEEFWNSKIGETISISFKSGCCRGKVEARLFKLVGYGEGVIFVIEESVYYNDKRPIMIYTDSIQMVR